MLGRITKVFLEALDNRFSHVGASSEAKMLHRVMHLAWDGGLVLVRERLTESRSKSANLEFERTEDLTFCSKRFPGGRKKDSPSPNVKTHSGSKGFPCRASLGPVFSSFSERIFDES